MQFVYVLHKLTLSMERAGRTEEEEEGERGRAGGGRDDSKTRTHTLGAWWELP